MYIVINGFKHMELDDYEQGCEGEGMFYALDVSFQSDTLETMLDKLKEYSGCDDVLLNSCEEQGRVDIQGYECDDGTTPCEIELKTWKQGKKELYLVTYTYTIYKAEVSKLIEGY